VGLQLRVEFDGTATPVTVANGGSGVISASRSGQTLNFTSVASIMVQGTSAADTLGWAGPISQGLTFNGSGGNDTIDVTGGIYTFSSDAKNMSPSGSVAITVGAGGTAMFNATQHLRSLTVLDGGGAVLGANGSRVLRTAGLSVAPTGTVDLKDNDLIVDDGSYTDVRAKVLAGFGGGLGGITSTSSDGSQILALFDNALIGSTDWNGETIGANAVVGKYTYFGDVNFDGQVTGDDYTIIDSNLNTTPAVGLEWLSGDANLDGIVTGDDYTTIDSNLGLGSGNPLSASSLSVVPEPGSIALIAAPVALGLVRRRRRIN
jgi:hypothetical protein